jgi:hypothetical protein
MSIVQFDVEPGSSTVGSDPLGNFILYLILQQLTRTPIRTVMIRSAAF